MLWRHPLRRRERAVIRQLARDCAGRGIELCLAIHPFIGTQSWAPEHAAVRFHPTAGRDWFLRNWQAREPGAALSPDPPLRYEVPHDVDTLAARCLQAHACGVRAFALCLDDIDPATSGLASAHLAEAQCEVITGLLARLRAAEPSARLFVVPTLYWTRGARANPAYASRLARGLPPGVDVFWTGEEVRSHAITKAQAREAATLYGRPPVVWLNYASNDSFRFSLQLPPAPPPAADLMRETAGLVMNPMRQVGFSRLHALVMGEYLLDPTRYVHASALKRAMVHLVGEPDVRVLERILTAWSAYPDPRTLGDDLARDNRPWRRRLLARLEACRAELEDVFPQLRADDGLHAELLAATERVGLLVEALRLRERELHECGGSIARRRDHLLARLADVDDDTGSDARLVLDSSFTQATGSSNLVV